MREVTFDCTMFSSTAARFMLPILATASIILKSSASMCIPPSQASIVTTHFPSSRLSQQRSPLLDPEVATALGLPRNHVAAHFGGKELEDLETVPLSRCRSLPSLVESARLPTSLDTMPLDSVVGGIPIPSPVIFRLCRRIGNPGDGFYVLQAKFHGYQETERCPMLDCKGLAIEVCGEQRLWMVCRRQVD